MLFSGVDLGTCAWLKRWDALNLVMRTQDTSHGQNGKNASVVMLLLVFGQQIFHPVLPIFIVFVWSAVIVEPSLHNQCSFRTCACFWKY